jgi:hypothetical protein
VLERALATETDPFLISRYTFYLAQSYRDCGERTDRCGPYLSWPQWLESRCAARQTSAALSATHCGVLSSGFRLIRARGNDFFGGVARALTRRPQRRLLGQVSCIRKPRPGRRLRRARPRPQTVGGAQVAAGRELSTARARRCLRLWCNPVAPRAREGACGVSSSAAKPIGGAHLPSAGRRRSPGPRARLS